MSESQLKRISRDLIDRADRGAVPKEGLGEWFDDYFVGQLKQAELQHAEVDARLFDGLRSMAKTDLLPHYQQYQREVERVQERREKRKLWQYVLGTVLVLEVFETLLTRGRSLLPQLLIPTAIFYSFMGGLLFAAANYVDERHLKRARRRFELAMDGLDEQVVTNVDYDSRRELLQADVLRTEVLDILVHYPVADDFWRDYRKVREADPQTAQAVDALKIPGFAKFLKFHVEGAYSAAARQQRFNRLFLEAQEVFVSRDREGYALQHLKPLTRNSA